MLLEQLSKKEYKFSSEHREKIRLACIKKYKEGFVNPMKGRKHSERAKNKMNRLGMRHTLESRIKMSLGHRGKKLGEKNNFWKGGLTELSRQIKNLSEYVSWRKSVFERDNYTCQDCKVRGKCELNADHIVPFSFLIKKNDIKTQEEARGCLELWDVSNGRTLCRKCHIKTPTFALNAKYYVA